MNQRQLLRLFPKASKSVLALNQEFGTGTPDTSTRLEVQDSQSKKQKGTLVQDRSRKAPRPGRPLVRFTLCRIRFLDPDAKYGSVKDLLDGLQYAGLVCGDREDQITLQVEQEKVGHFEDERTIIDIIYP